MCGIAGLASNLLGEDSKRELNLKMLEKIRHRGPEATNVFIDGPVSLGHNRLKIIDLSDEANQPFEYQGVVLIFNGEVYNYVELKVELEKSGFQFRTKSDTEVICAAYKHWGEDCVKHFVGMWAFAIWDIKERKLFCSRDRFGIKPFYYIQQGENFYFASEYKALKQVPSFKKDLNIEQLNRGLQMVWAVYKDETYYTHLKSLQPAQNLVWQYGKVSIHKYWDIDFDRPKSKLSWDEKKETFYSLFQEKERQRPHALCLYPCG